MRAGNLRHRVTIQRVALATADSYGQQTEEWSDVATVWAEVRSLNGIEGWKAKQIQPEASVQVLMRYTSDLTPADRLLYGTRYLHPVSVLPDVRNTQLTILCREQL
jgi:SPP1 family predicted phage head-tail adaptor